MSLLWSLYSIVAALAGIAVLIFFHELGHLLVGAWCGLRIEGFSIGFGRALWKKEWRGIEWRVGFFPLGGYVRFAEQAEEEEPSPEYLLSASCWKRIVVAAAGPITNLLLAFVLFTGVFLAGGRPVPYSVVSKAVGWIDAESPLRQKDLDLGDRIETLNHRPYTELENQLLANVYRGMLMIEGTRAQWGQEGVEPKKFAVQAQSQGAARLLWDPATFLEIGRPDSDADPFIEGSPLWAAGAQMGDRLIWLDGQPVLSAKQVGALLNDGRCLLTVERAGSVQLVRARRMNLSQISEVAAARVWRDWLRTASIRTRFVSPWVLPVLLNDALEVEEDLLGPSEWEEGAVSVHRGAGAPAWLADVRLLPGDRILAVDGKPVADGAACAAALQQRFAHVIVERQISGASARTTTPWPVAEAERRFYAGFDTVRLDLLLRGFIRQERLLQAGSLLMLRPVAVKPLVEFRMTPARADATEIEVSQRRKAALEISDPIERAEALKKLDADLRRNVLGLVGSLSQPLVWYNPGPATQFMQVLRQTGMTLGGLVSGRVSSKLVSGPVGIVAALQSGFSSSLGVALHWLGLISLGLAVFNLLPVPPLDGGNILIAGIEGICRRRLSQQWLQRIYLLFMALLLTFLLFVTWQDVLRLFGRG